MDSRTTKLAPAHLEVLQVWRSPLLQALSRATSFCSQHRSHPREVSAYRRVFCSCMMDPDPIEGCCKSIKQPCPARHSTGAVSLLQAMLRSLASRPLPDDGDLTSRFSGTEKSVVAEQQADSRQPTEVDTTIEAKAPASPEDEKSAGWFSTSEGGALAASPLLAWLPNCPLAWQTLLPKQVCWARDAHTAIAPMLNDAACCLSP